MFSDIVLMVISMNPWDYLGTDALADNLFSETGMLAQNASFWSSLFLVLRDAGFIGCLITLAIAFVKLASSSQNIRSDAKEVIGNKLILIFVITIAAYAFGYVMWAILKI